MDALIIVGFAGAAIITFANGFMVGYEYRKHKEDDKRREGGAR